MHLYLAGNNKLLTDQRLVDQDCEALYRLLQNNVFITSLDLRYNNITDEGAKWIAKLLEVCCPVTLCPLFMTLFLCSLWECSGSVVECFTREWPRL